MENSSHLKIEETLFTPKRLAYPISRSSKVPLLKKPFIPSRSASSLLIPCLLVVPRLPGIVLCFSISTPKYHPNGVPAAPGRDAVDWPAQHNTNSSLALQAGPGPQLANKLNEDNPVPPRRARGQDNADELFISLLVCVYSTGLSIEESIEVKGFTIRTQSR
ncbi:hypothetical protein EVAR_27493_1 [Eumeta japonica]|uniref:Uncharacterized protein n=1 Tax=Eumeta variegata TaxID=151549 RepID=A0A4C1XCN5_EUMVA|nr:hypothetical protein EVAR_27493_1 [Eumeta japonica]